MLSVRRRLSTVAVALAAPLLALAVPMGSAQAYSSPSGVFMSDYDARLVTLINEGRVANGRQPLTVMAGPTDGSRVWSQQMASERRLYHDPVYSQALTAAGCKWSMVAENVAYTTKDADSMFAMYKNSPGHWKNILNSQVTQLGVATVERISPEGFRYKYNTMRFANGCSTSYGPSRRMTWPIFEERVTPGALTMPVAAFETGRDFRVGTANWGSGLDVTATPVFDAPNAATDQAARFMVRTTSGSASGAAGMHLWQGMDLTKASALSVKLSQTNAAGRALPVTVQVLDHWGAHHTLGKVNVTGAGQTFTFPLPAAARSYQTQIRIYTDAAALNALGATVAERRSDVAVWDVTASTGPVGSLVTTDQQRQGRRRFGHMMLPWR